MPQVEFYCVSIYCMELCGEYKLLCIVATGIQNTDSYSQVHAIYATMLLYYAYLHNYMFTHCIPITYSAVLMHK